MGRGLSPPSYRTCSAHNVDAGLQPGVYHRHARKVNELFPANRLLERGHVDYEAILNVALEQALVGFVDLLDFDQLDVGSDALFGAEVEHLLGFLDTANRGARERPARHQKIERSNR